MYNLIDPNDKKRHSVDNLRASREKVRKTLKQQSDSELKSIQQSNMDLLKKLTDYQE